MKRPILVAAVAAGLVWAGTMEPVSAFPNPGLTAAASTKPYAKPEPAYAKWGRMAVNFVHKRYPDAQVIDYLHVGRSRPAAGESAETFKLWLRRGSREFGVFVTITFDDSTGQIRRVSFRETSR
jgi:hypothetical protein